MLPRRARVLAAIIGIGSSFGGAGAQAVPTVSTTGPSSTPPPVPSVSTCPSRTINYITETLPQQCLRTDWSSNVTSTEPQYGFIIVTTGEADQSTTIIAHQGDGKSVTINHTSAEPAQSTVGSSASTPSADGTPGEASSASSSTASATAERAAEEEADPLLDAANFVSFEEWKVKMLEKEGRSPENIGSGQKGTTDQERRRQAGDIHQALDSLGDDAEIELDFGGFVDPDTVASALPSSKLSSAEEIPEAEPEAVAAGVSRRSKNAGTTSKERFNFASFDCAATVRKTNPECKGPNYILSENKDSYMLNPCSVKNKFFIVELCNEILIDTIALGNYEFFSSTFRQIRFSISESYPVKIDKWRELGTFEAQNRRGVQAFLIENGLTWGRYLRIELLGHYGSEYYCPVSLLRVHGTTMMDDYRDFKTTKVDDDVEDAAAAEPEKAIEQKVQIPEAGNNLAERPSAASHAMAEHRTKEIEATPTPTKITGPIPNTSTGASETSSTNFKTQKRMLDHPNCRGPGDFSDGCPRTNYFSPLLEQFDLFTSSCDVAARFCNQELTKKIEVVRRPASLVTPISIPPHGPKATHPASKSLVEYEAPNGPPFSTYHIVEAADGKTAVETGSSQASAASEPTGAATDTEKAKLDQNTGNKPPAGTKSVSTNSTHSNSRTPVQPAPAATPSTQESFFKSVHKRLQLLESNSTLSLQYIEEQSRLLREAFTKVEKRQLSKTTNFLASLNETVLSELRDFRTQYEQIWQSTILELSSQREQSVKEAGALSARLTILADEVVWQKRLVYLQFGLILLCAVAFIFLHSPAGSEAQRYLELPMLRDILTRSPPASTARYGRMRPRANTSASVRSAAVGVFDSPPSSPSRPISRSGLSWAHLTSPSSPSDEESDGSPLKTFEHESNGYQPLTPPPDEEFRANNEAEAGSSDDAGLLAPEPDSILRRAASSPALRRDEPQAEEEDDDLASHTEPPRVAELARDVEQKECEEGGLSMRVTPEVKAKHNHVS